MIKTIFTLLCIVFLLPIASEAQRKKKSKTYPVYDVPKRPSANERFLKTQWWLGFKAGGNATAVTPETKFSGFSPVNYNATENEKTYEDYDGISGHAGLEITFYHHGWSFSFQPNYRRQQFTYDNDYNWEETNNPDNSLVLNYKQNHLLDYIELPLFIKYDLTQTKFRPFIQVGAYYATLVNAQKAVEISGTDFASGDAGPFETQELIIGVNDLFLKSSTGLAGGVGFSYDFWNVRLVFDATYRHGLNNIVNVKNRYAVNELASIGDAMDDIKLKNISVAIGCVFPLRFISEGYQSTN